MAGKSSEMDVSEVCEAKGATVHGMLIGELSPVKESRSTVGVRYFEGQFSDGKKTVRIVSFEPKLRSDLERLKNSSESVALMNCSVQKSKRPGSDELEIVAGSRSSCMPSPKKFKVDQDAAALRKCVIAVVGSLEVVKQLAVNQHITVTGKVVSMEGVEQVNVKARNVTLKKEGFVIADDTSAIKGVAWEKDVGVLKVGCTYKFTNVTVRMFSGVKFLSLSESAMIEEVADIGEVVEENVDEGLDGVKIVKGEIAQVEKCESYSSCRTCKAKIVAENEIVGKCPKCEAKVKMSKCLKSVSTRLVIVDDDDREYRVTAFDDMLKNMIGGQIEEDIEDKLLRAPVMVFTINKKDIVCAVSTVV